MSNVIFSAETLAWISDVRQLKTLRKELRRRFNKVEIYFYIRRQDLLVVSHNQEASKGRPSRVFYGNQSVALPKYMAEFDEYLDYHSKLSMWGDLFGDESIKVRIFEEKKLVDGNVVADFLYASGLDLTPRLLQSNQSLGREKVLLSHYMLDAGVPVEVRKKVLEFIEDSERLKPSKQEAQEFYAHYRSSNIALNNRFNVSEKESIFSDNFDSYPEVSGDLWDANSVGRAVYGLINVLLDQDIIDSPLA
ncbi:hypothetical protein [Arenicella chitinivorans]|uniref:hypothetical protein n=1 Tax=Arenicella chitinivorans TaxID=1329800 RepID=UPI0016780B4C|nr:hypothetical protein [Arenicella chitinivorans]